MIYSLIKVHKIAIEDFILNSEEDYEESTNMEELLNSICKPSKDATISVNSVEAESLMFSHLSQRLNNIPEIQTDVKILIGNLSK